jgi:hypothetical protein
MESHGVADEIVAARHGTMLGSNSTWIWLHVQRNW